jgi:sugar phosphate isomerase/epimerase
MPETMRDSVRPFCLVSDASLRKEVMKRARELGISLDCMEGFIISPIFTLDLANTAMDAAQEMGIKRINTVNFDTDETRMSENLTALCETAAGRGFEINIEFMPLLPLFVSLKETARRLAAAKYPRLTIMLDILHHVRSGGTVAEVAAYAHLISGAQFSDGPLTVAGNEAYMHAATHERDIPGHGRFPLRDILKVMSPDAMIYLEVPKKSFREQGLGPTERARRLLEGMRAVEAMS